MHKKQPENDKLIESDSQYVVVLLERLFGAISTRGEFLDRYGVPTDLSDKTVIISGREVRTVLPIGVRTLLVALQDRRPLDIISTHFNEIDQHTFIEAYYSTDMTADYAFVPYEDIPQSIRDEAGI